MEKLLKQNPLWINAKLQMPVGLNAATEGIFQSKVFSPFQGYVATSNKISNWSWGRGWTLFVRKNGMKNWSKTTIFKILRWRSFYKNFPKIYFCSAKNTPSCAKIFQKCFFLAENKVPEVEILFFAKVFIFFFIKFFTEAFTFFDSRIVGLTENV